MKKLYLVVDDEKLLSVFNGKVNFNISSEYEDVLLKLIYINAKSIYKELSFKDKIKKLFCIVQILSIKSSQIVSKNDNEAVRSCELLNNVVELCKDLNSWKLFEFSIGKMVFYFTDKFPSHPINLTIKDYIMSPHNECKFIWREIE